MKKIDDSVLLQMLQEGKPQREIARHFGVADSAITKCKKKILASLNIPESFKSLSDKEKRFVLARAEGKTQTQAALDAFECGSMGSAKSLGHALMKRDDIQVAISDLMEEEGLGRRHRIKVLKKHIDNDLDRHASLKGIDIANKMEGVYVEKQITATVPYVEVCRELESLEAQRVECLNGLKEIYASQMKEELPDISQEMADEMAEKAIEAIFPENKETTKLKRQLGLLPSDKASNAEEERVIDP